MPRRFIRKDNWEFGGTTPASEASGEPKSRKRRLATTLAFTTLFFAGASLAAVAGDQLSPYMSSDRQSEAASAEDAATAEADATAPNADPTASPESDPAATAAAPDATATPEADASATAAAPDATAAPDAAAATDGDLAASSSDPQDAIAPTRARGTSAAAPFSGSNATAAHASPKGKKARQRAKTNWLRAVLLPNVKPAPEPEIEGPADAATIWINSQLPDPTPPALRLSPKFAANLKKASKGAGIDWAVMLGILRARGATGHSPADRVTLNRLASRLGSLGPAKGEWATIIAYSGDANFADKAAALARYDRAVGLKALVKGLEAAKQSIATRLLSDPMVSIYDGGRNDIIANKVDVRVLAMIAYLRQSFGQVTVSCLISGHRLYARPGVISAHIPGHAVDIVALGDKSIQGNQEPGGLTERAVREILFLPAELMPRQVISLLGLGGPSFPLADHYNHIHIGY